MIIELLGTRNPSTKRKSSLISKPTSALFIVDGLKIITDPDAIQTMGSLVLYSSKLFREDVAHISPNVTAVKTDGPGMSMTAYIISDSKARVCYAPFTTAWPDESPLTEGIDLYIGNAVSMNPFSSSFPGKLVSDQIELCNRHCISTLVLSNFGSSMIGRGLRGYWVSSILNSMYNINTIIAFDGMTIDLAGLYEMDIASAVKYDLTKLDKSELLSLHLRCHQLYHSKYVSDKTRRLVVKLHKLIVAEMKRRGLNHNSPLK